MYIVISNTIGSVKRIRIGRVKFLITSSLKSTSISSCLAWMPQFLVLRRSSAALWMRTTGGYVSGMKAKRRRNEDHPMMEEM